ncbi:MAG: response regulator [Desulfotignum sp.]
MKIYGGDQSRMDAAKIILGKRVLIVDDEKDVLDSLTELLNLCKIDTATSFDKAKELLGKNYYDIAILDIMGVDGFKLLEIAIENKIPALMLTANALTPESLKKSVEDGAAYFVPKDQMENIDTYIADVIEAKEKNKNPWVRWMGRLGGVLDVLFTGPDWREREKDFWKKYRDNY